MWASEEVIAAGDCPAAPHAIAAAVRAGLRIDDAPAEPHARFIREVGLPIGGSVGVGAPWDGRLTVGANALADPGVCCVIGRVTLTLGFPLSVSVGSGELAEVTADVGWIHRIGSHDARLGGGVSGGVATAWGRQFAVNQLGWQPVASVWAGGGAAPVPWLRVDGAARGNLSRVGMVAAAGSHESTDVALAEPWIRFELTVTPLIARETDGAP